MAKPNESKLLNQLLTAITQLPDQLHDDALEAFNTVVEPYDPAEISSEELVELLQSPALAPYLIDDGVVWVASKGTETVLKQVRQSLEGRATVTEEGQIILK